MLDKSKRWFLVLLLAATVPVWCTGAGEASKEDKVKGGFLVNFLKFIKWPDRSFQTSSSPYVIGIVGNSSMRSVFSSGSDLGKISGRNIVGKMIDLKDISAVSSEIRDCHILYISPSESGRYKEIIDIVSNSPILTVGDTDGFVESGGIIEFYKSKRMVRFKIKHSAAKKVSLKISSKLLRVAKIVE